VCLLGSTGSGKSQSQSYIKKLLMQTFVLDETGDPYGSGVKWIKNPASGEVLIKQFSRPVKDAHDKVVAYAPVLGVVDYPEMSALMSRANRDGSNLDAALIDLYDRDPTFGSTSMSGGTVVSPEPYGCLMTTGQPAAFKRLVGQKDLDNGFLNRFLFVGGKEKDRHPTGGGEIDLTPLIPAVGSLSNWTEDNPQIDYSEDGAAAWAEFFHGTVMPHVKADQSQILGRAVLTCKKLMLLMAADQRKALVDAHVVAQVRELYGYLIRCYGISTTSMMVTDESEIIDEITDKLHRHQDKKHHDGLSANDLRRYMNPRFRKQNRLIEVTLRTMEALGDVVKVESAQRGPGKRPGARYHLSEGSTKYST
jgi:hypothetical protein